MLKFLKRLTSLSPFYFEGDKPEYDSRIKIINKHSNLPGAKPSLDALWYDNAIAINYADDIIYRNVDGVIVAYKPEKQNDVQT